MKRYLILMILTMMLISTKVEATEYSQYLPGGKNYLDEQNITFTSSSMFTNDAIMVKPDTFYTLTLPGTDLLTEDIFLHIEGSTTYLDDNITLLDECVVELQDVHCTFKTTVSENSLSIIIDSVDVLSYYTHYGFEYFQLEEGTSSTSYEAYIPPEIDNIEPIFTGSGAFIKSYRDQISLTEIIQQHIEVIDEIDGNLNDQISIISDQYTANQDVIGEYQVLIQACDYSNNCATFNLTIIVKDEILPVITGPSSVDIDVGNPIEINTLINTYFTYSDEYDPSCALSITSDSYTPNKQVLGTYQVVFEVADDSLNKVTKSFVVNVKDIGKPIIQGDFSYISPLSNPLTTSQILSNLIITDNIDAYADLTIDVINDTFTISKYLIGTYSMTVSVTDLSGNNTTQSIEIIVRDDIYPNLAGPSTYSYSYQESFTLPDFLAMLVVSDNESQLTNSNIYVISDSFTNRTSQIGEYAITFGVKDASNNESTHTILITIFDDVAPVIYVDNFIVTVNLSSTFKTEDALQLLINAKELAAGYYTTTTIIDEYTGHEKQPGSYLQKYLFTNEFGEEFEKEFIVQVVGEGSITWDQNLIVRNVLIYSVVLGISIFIFLKNKK